MTLHEAIELILQETGEPMTSSTIADMVNKRNLYSRNDGLPVSTSQVTARVSNYEQIFVKENGKIRLLKNDIATYGFQRMRIEILHSLGTNHYTEKSKRISLLLRSLEDFLDDGDSNPHYYIEQEPTAYHGITTKEPRYKLKAAYKLCNWFFSQAIQTQGVFNDQLATILSGLDWFANAHNFIKIDFNGIHHFLLKLASENPISKFKIQLGDHLELARKNHESFDVNLRIMNLINNSIGNHFSSSHQFTTEIIIPPFGRKAKREVPIEFERILSEIESPSKELNRAIVIVPSGVLTNRSQSYINARKKLVSSNTLMSVVALPNGMMENTAINLSLLLFNFKERNDNIFFCDIPDNISDHFEEILRTINGQEEIKDVSKRVNIDNLNNDFFDLNPNLYTFDPHEIEIKKGYKKHSIKNLIDVKKSGRRLKNRNSLYAGGEYKLIRTSEIDKDKVYFQQNESMLGIDHDVLENPERHLVSGGIVFSGFNKKMKANILSPEETYALGQDVFWIKINSSIILEEYFVNEIYQPYVIKQVEFYSKGVAISRLSLKDFLKIQMQIPSLEKQKEILFTDFRKHELSSESQVISNKELDFIKTLKHTLKQPISGMGNDFSSLRSFLNSKIVSGESLISNKPIVPVFDTDTPEQIDIHTLENTLDRMGRAISDIDYILEQAMLIITAASSPILENIELKPFLSNFIFENPEISINVKGPKLEILGDRKQLRILINNFIDNAKRHGFKDHWDNPMIWMEIKNKDSQSIQISIRNNGKSLPFEFTIEDFLAKGKSTKADVGSGFGGFLIGQIVKNHNGTVELVKRPKFSILPHNVEFLITLPR